MEELQLLATMLRPDEELQRPDIMSRMVWHWEALHRRQGGVLIVGSYVSLIADRLGLNLDRSSRCPPAEPISWKKLVNFKWIERRRTTPPTTIWRMRIGEVELPVRSSINVYDQLTWRLMIDEGDEDVPAGDDDDHPEPPPHSDPMDTDAGPSRRVSPDAGPSHRGPSDAGPSHRTPSPSRRTPPSPHQTPQTSQFPGTQPGTSQHPGTQPGTSQHPGTQPGISQDQYQALYSLMTEIRACQIIHTREIRSLREQQSGLSGRLEMHLAEAARRRREERILRRGGFRETAYYRYLRGEGPPPPSPSHPPDEGPRD